VALIAQILVSHTLAAARILEPDAGAEVTLDPTEILYIRTILPETILRGRPWIPHRRLATLRVGTRLAVRGTTPSRDSAGCHGKPWYAVYPFGYLCSEHARPASEGPPTATAMAVPAGRRLPHRYAFVRQQGTSIFTTRADARNNDPSDTLTKGMSLVIESTLAIDGIPYVHSAAGYVRKDDIRWGGQGSNWSGVAIHGRHLGPSFAWVSKANAPVFTAPSETSTRQAKLKRRTRVPLLDERQNGRTRWLRIGESRWMRSTALNEVHIVRPPHDVVDNSGEFLSPRQWIDVDLGEQTLVAYRGAQPRFATLISSGRSHPTPRGNYPVWAKVASMTMASQEYEDDAYMVQGVPWVLLFQGHNALHGAYWHDRFGARRSHGCVNLSPLDARWVFEWSGPSLPQGWTGYLPGSRDRSTLIHIRDSSREEGERFTQDRPTGPPDREQERIKREAAALRRAEDAAQEHNLGLAQDGFSWMSSAGTPEGSAPYIEAPPLPPLLGIENDPG